MKKFFDKEMGRLVNLLSPQEAVQITKIYVNHCIGRRTMSEARMKMVSYLYDFITFSNTIEVDNFVEQLKRFKVTQNLDGDEKASYNKLIEFFKLYSICSKSNDVNIIQASEYIISMDNMKKEIRSKKRANENLDYAHQLFDGLFNVGFNFKELSPRICKLYEQKVQSAVSSEDEIDVSLEQEFAYYNLKDLYDTKDDVEEVKNEEDNKIENGEDKSIEKVQENKEDEGKEADIAVEDPKKEVELDTFKINDEAKKQEENKVIESNIKEEKVVVKPLEKTESKEETLKVDIQTPNVVEEKKEIPQVKVDPPKVEVPRVKVPKPENMVREAVQIPEIKVPQINVEMPKEEIPQVQIPQVKIEPPKVEVPRVEVPKPENIVKETVQIPEIKVPQINVEIPKEEIPQVQIPQVKIEPPKVEVPRVEVPKPENIVRETVQIPEIKVPQINVEVPKEEIPQVQIPQVSVNTTKEDTQRNEVKQEKDKEQIPQIEVSIPERVASTQNDVRNNYNRNNQNSGYNGNNNYNNNMNRNNNNANNSNSNNNNNGYNGNSGNSNNSNNNRYEDRRQEDRKQDENRNLQNEKKVENDRNSGNQNNGGNNNSTNNNNRNNNNQNNNQNNVNRQERPQQRSPFNTRKPFISADDILKATQEINSNDAFNYFGNSVDNRRNSYSSNDSDSSFDGTGGFRD